MASVLEPPTAEDFHQLRPGLWVWSAYSPVVKCDLWTTAWAGPEGLVLFDPIPLDADAFGIIINEAGSPAAIVLTNANHERSTAALSRQYGAKTVVPLSGKHTDIQIEPDSWIRPEETIAGACAYDLSGGAPGETAYLTSDKILVVGDALINLSCHGGLQLLPLKYCQDSLLLADSVLNLTKLDIEIATFAHGEPIRNNVSAKLACCVAN